MKSTTYFAQDALEVSSVLTSLTEHINAAPYLYWAALVDGAFDFPEVEQTPYALEGINCYSFDVFEGLEAASPWLISLSLEDQSVSQLRELLIHCRGRPMLSFVASLQPIPSLAKKWADLHWIYSEDDQRMLLRLADTRILPELPHALSSEQWAAFTADLNHWYYINRQGLLAACSLAAKDITPSSQIRLTQGQLDILLEASEPDTVIDLIVEGMQEIIPSHLKKSEFYSLIYKTCELGRLHGVEIFSDTVSLAVAACLTSGQSNSTPRLIALLSEKRWMPGKLGEAVLADGII